jgi:hypothetical protein
MKPMLYMRLVVDVFDRCISRKHSLSVIEVLLGAIPDSRLRHRAHEGSWVFIV